MALPVLIADDSAMSRKLIMRAFPDDWEVTVHQAADGDEALAQLDQCHARVMFLDLTMPGTDGFSVLSAIQERGLDVFVVVVSADVQPRAEEHAAELGAAAFLRKPLDAEELRNLLGEHGFV